MKSIVNLTHLSQVKIVDQNIVLPDTLEIDFKSNVYTNLDLVITARNGKEQKQYKVKLDNSIDLTSLLKGGLLDISIDGYCMGTKVKHWELYPIIVIESDGIFTLADKMKELEERLTVLEQKHKNVFHK